VKILHLANGNLYGGIEAFLTTLARFERESRGSLQHHFLLSHPGRLEEELRALGSRVYVQPGARLRKPWAIQRVRREARSFARQLAPDVVLAHGHWAYFVFGHAIVDSDVPVGFFQHGVATGSLLERLAARRRPAFVVANSELTAGTVGRISRGAEVVVCRCPVALPPPSASRSALRERLGAGADVVVVHTGRFEESKGHRLLLEALAFIRHLQWQLWYVGGQVRPIERNLRRALERTVATRRVSERVRFLGERSDVGDILCAADIYCQPNTGPEGFGIALLEAMSRGLPVVTTALGAVADPVGPEIGRRVRAESGDLAAALAELIEDRPKRELLGAAARSRFLEHHAPDVAIEEFARALHHCSRGRR
jgi:glycosyltransferase involved in cell wall biosynthesis